MGIATVEQAARLFHAPKTLPSATQSSGCSVPCTLTVHLKMRKMPLSPSGCSVPFTRTVHPYRSVGPNDLNDPSFSFWKQ